MSTALYLVGVQEAGVDLRGVMGSIMFLLHDSRRGTLIFFNKLMSFEGHQFKKNYSN